MEWQPIETAPRDGSSVLAVNAAGEMAVVVGAPGRRVWLDPLYDMTGIVPTHWMPLPAPPKTPA